MQVLCSTWCLQVQVLCGGDRATDTLEERSRRAGQVLFLSARWGVRKLKQASEVWYSVTWLLYYRVDFFFAWASLNLSSTRSHVNLIGVSPSARVHKVIWTYNIWEGSIKKKTPCSIIVCIINSSLCVCYASFNSVCENTGVGTIMWVRMLAILVICG